MKLQRMLRVLLVMTICLPAALRPGDAVAVQSNGLYQQMTQAERSSFVADQARHLARQMSRTDYQMTPAFEAEIQRAIDFYTRRIGSNGGDTPEGRLRSILERGTAAAPTVIKAFKAHNVSPIIGLYLAFIESSYVNIASPNPQGAVGMFQFLPKTGEQFGLKPDELLDVEKSADAAARYIAAALKRFSRDEMKEALAVLSYNRGVPTVERDVALIVNKGNRSCSICALTERRDSLDEAFRGESVHYVPQFFAAAIIGENPQAFGFQMQPLSSLK